MAQIPKLANLKELVLGHALAKSMRWDKIWSKLPRLEKLELRSDALPIDPLPSSLLELAIVPALSISHPKTTDERDERDEM